MIPVQKFATLNIVLIDFHPVLRVCFFGPELAAPNTISFVRLTNLQNKVLYSRKSNLTS